MIDSMQYKKTGNSVLASFEGKTTVMLPGRDESTQIKFFLSLYLRQSLLQKGALSICDDLFQNIMLVKQLKEKLKQSFYNQYVTKF